MENLGFTIYGQTGWERLFSKVPMYSDGAKFLGKAGAWSTEYWFPESDVRKEAK